MKEEISNVGKNPERTTERNEWWVQNTGAERTPYFEGIIKHSQKVPTHLPTKPTMRTFWGEPQDGEGRGGLASRGLPSSREERGPEACAARTRATPGTKTRCRLCSPEEGTERADGTGKAENQNVRRRRTGAGLERGARPVPGAAPGSFPGTPGWISGHPHDICHGRRSSSPPPGPRDCRLRTGSSLLQGPRPGLPSLHPDSSRRPQLCPHPQPRPRQPPARATASWRVSLLCPTRCVLYRTPKASLEPAVSPVTP